jgi:uncharacterized protein YrrD
MRKGKDIVGKPVIAYDSGEKVETIVDLIFDHYDNRLLGFLIDEGGWFSNAKVLPLDLVQAIGVDAVIIPSQDVIVSSSKYPAIHKILEKNNILNGTRIMTSDGQDLGTLVDFYFDEHTGAIEGYESAGGLFADNYSGRSFVPAPQTLKIGADVTFVPVATADLMAEQVCNLKAAQPGVKLQDYAKMTEAIVDKAAQKAFVLDKVAHKTVDTHDGSHLVLAGEVINLDLSNIADQLGLLDELYRSASLSVERSTGDNSKI